MPWQHFQMPSLCGFSFFNDLIAINMCIAGSVPQWYCCNDFSNGESAVFDANNVSSKDDIDASIDDDDPWTVSISAMHAIAGIRGLAGSMNVLDIHVIC